MYVYTGVQHPEGRRINKVHFMYAGEKKEAFVGGCFIV